GRSAAKKTVDLFDTPWTPCRWLSPGRKPSNAPRTAAPTNVDGVRGRDTAAARSTRPSRPRPSELADFRDRLIHQRRQREREIRRRLAALSLSREPPRRGAQLPHGEPEVRPRRNLEASRIHQAPRLADVREKRLRHPAVAEGIG